MGAFNNITFDQVVTSLMAIIAIRELLVIVLPDQIAGPKGWLIRTGEDS